MSGPRPVVPDELGHRGGRGRRSSWRDGATGRQYVIAFFGSFHGRSYGSVSLTASKSTYRAGFGPLLPGVLHAYYGDGRDMQMAPGSAEDGFPTIDYIEHFLFKRSWPHEIAAIVVEPVQGEGGYIVPPDGWLMALRELCDRHGILLVADEVQCGHGPHRPDVGRRAHGRRAGHRAGRQGHRERHAARRHDRADAT